LPGTLVALMMRPDMSRTAPSPWILAAVLVASLGTGCAGVQRTEARDSYLARTFETYPLPRTCDALWPDALRVVMFRGYPLVGADRKLVDEEAQGAFASILSSGFATRRTPDGGLVTETDWDRQVGLRCRITCTPKGENAGKVVFTIIGGGAQGATEESQGPDWSMSMDLLRRLDPAEAARIDAAAPAAGK
jgi:hypothetical protein